MKLYFLPEDVATNEEVNLQLQFGPPPEHFKNKEEAHEWVRMNMPLGTYYEIHSSNDRVLFRFGQQRKRRKKKKFLTYSPVTTEFD